MARQWGGGMACVDQASRVERRAMGDPRERGFDPKALES